ncbi:MAG: NAD-dependent epimerase/dehydratase family protein [Promethearchaeota archaeon]
MRVLLTGAFGNVGTSTLKSLIKQGNTVRCFDIKNSKTKKIQKKYIKKYKFETFWGDITNIDDVYQAVKGVDSIIHLAGIIPPLSEKIPVIAYDVNVKGTENIVKSVKKLENQPIIVFASSCSVFGKTMSLSPPRNSNDPVNPSDNYTNQKIMCEKIIKESGLNWVILRIAAALPLKLPLKLDPILFEIPLNQRIEFLYTGDAGVAFANALNLQEKEKILLIGGGKKCQIYQEDFVKKILNTMGISMPSNLAFKQVENDSDWFYTDWLDTEESQDLLEYQNNSFEDYIEKLNKNGALRRLGLKILSPLVKMSLLKMSPYYKLNKKIS